MESTILLELRHWFAAALFVTTSGNAWGAEPTGGTTTVLSPTAIATVRFPGVAHDPVRDVLLVVSGQDAVEGRFVDGSGSALASSFVIAQGGVLAPRVAYAPMLDGFAICWLDEPAASVACRAVRASGATPEWLYAVPAIDDPATVEHGESAPSLACSAGECLVVWTDVESTGEIRARRLGPDLQPLGPVIFLPTGNGFDGFPSVAYVPTRSEYVVAFTTEPVDNQQTVALSRIAVGSDAPLGAPVPFIVTTGLANYPEIACDPDSGRCLVICYYFANGPDVWGRMLGPDGQPEGDVIPIAASPGFEGGDGIGLAFNSATQTFLAVYQGPESSGQLQQVYASEIGLDGVSGPSFQATTANGSVGVYQPRVAARSGFAEWSVVLSVDYTHVDLQRIQGQAAPVENDGGIPTLDSGLPDGGGSGGVDSGPPPSNASNDGSGCGCRTTREPTGSAIAWSLLLALAVARRRRERDILS